MLPLIKGVLNGTEKPADRTSQTKLLVQFAAECVGGTLFAFDVAAGEINIAVFAITAEQNMTTIQADATGDNFGSLH